MTIYTITYIPLPGQVSQTNHFFFLVKKGGNVLSPLAYRVEGLLGGVRDLDRVFVACKFEGGPEGGLDAERVECRV